jgi:hypothetical protein
MYAYAAGVDEDVAVIVGDIVFVTVGVTEAVALGVAVNVSVPVSVTVNVGVVVIVSVGVAVTVSVGVVVTVNVGVAVTVNVGVPVGVTVSVTVCVTVGVTVGVNDGVTVNVGVTVGVTVGVAVYVGMTNVTECEYPEGSVVVYPRFIRLRKGFNPDVPAIALKVIMSKFGSLPLFHSLPVYDICMFPPGSVTVPPLWLTTPETVTSPGTPGTIIKTLDMGPSPCAITVYENDAGLPTTACVGCIYA